MGSSEMYIGTNSGVVREAAVKRKKQEQRFVWAELDAVVGTPRKATPSNAQSEGGDQVPAARCPIAPGGDEPA